MSSKAETLRRLIVGDLRRVFRHRYRRNGYTFTDDDPGRDDLEVTFASPLALPDSAEREDEARRRALGTVAGSTEAQELVDQIMRLAKG